MADGTASSIAILLNGREESVEAGLTVSRLLELRGLPRERVAVEVNGEIVRKTRYDSFALPDGARVEVVSFVGGG